MLNVMRLKNKLSDRQKALIRKGLQLVLSFIPHSHNLEMLAIKHGTDKWGHSYIKHYEQYFARLRKQSLNILEIGIGGYNDPKSGGSSLRMWQDYFPNSTIYGIDVYDKKFHNDKRIKTFIGSQNDPDFLKRVATNIGLIDIIIDDGSHINEHVLTSFNILFPYLVDGGFYIIEDVQTSYWPQDGGNWKDLNDPGTTMFMLKSLVDGLNYQCIPNRIPTFTDKNIISIHFYRNIAFIIKGQNDHLLSNYTLKELEKAKAVPLDKNC